MKEGPAHLSVILVWVGGIDCIRMQAEQSKLVCIVPLRCSRSASPLLWDPALASLVDRL